MVKKHYLVGITSALGAVLWMSGPISHVVSVIGKQLVRDFYFSLLEYFVLFLFFFLFCCTPTLFLATMEIQHWRKMLKWSLKSFICFLFPLSCFNADKFAPNHWLPWAVLKTLHLQPAGWLCTGLVSAVASDVAQKLWKKIKSRRYSRTLRISLSPAHGWSLQWAGWSQKFPVLREIHASSQGWEALLTNARTPQPLSEVLENLSFPSHFNNSKIRSVGKN